MNRRLAIAASVVLFHMAALWAIQTGLLRRAVEVIVPAERGVEVDADVFDGPRSIALPIAGCRTATAAAIMKFLLEKR